METISWKNGCASPVGNFSDLALNVPARATAVRRPASESADGDGRKPNAEQTLTIEKTSATPSKPGLNAMPTTGGSTAEPTPSIANETEPNSVSGIASRQSPPLQRRTRRRPRVRCGQACIGSFPQW